MKAENLMIGNYVACEKPFKIERINRYSVQFEGEGYYVDIRGINPIPITESTLLKFGFEKNQDYSHTYDEYKINFNSFTITVDSCSNNPNRYWYCHIDSEKHETVGGCDIQYVHELQNLIRVVTGETFEIDM